MREMFSSLGLQGGGGHDSGGLFLVISKVGSGTESSVRTTAMSAEGSPGTKKPWLQSLVPHKLDVVLGL